MNNFEGAWQEALAKVRSKVSQTNYNKWIRPIQFLSADNDSVRLGVPNSFFRDWISEYYLELLSHELRAAAAANCSLELVVTEEDPATSLEEAPEPHRVQQGPSSDKTKRLNPKYTFDKFVVGTANQFAHAAAASAADLPGGHYNPLFIYGGVGLGKTHLLNAIGLKIASAFPNLKIIYLSAEQFMNELIYSIRFEKMDDFRRKYRESCDVLLVDDVPFISGKERTVEEFFHTFNTLYDTQRQIVVTSDRPPHELDGLGERLRSRFEWGLIADIQPPDLETRIAILKKKADHGHIDLSDETALFLASQIKSNVRELEGSLIRLSAFASLEGSPITVDLAKEVLKNTIRERAAACSIEAIQRAVSEFYNIKVADLKSPRRMKSIAGPRQVAMYLCKEHLRASYPEIGLKFGGKDHSTVIHAVKKIVGLLAANAPVRQEVEMIEKSLLD